MVWVGDQEGVGEGLGLLVWPGDGVKLWEGEAVKVRVWGGEGLEVGLGLLDAEGLRVKVLAEAVGAGAHKSQPRELTHQN